MRHATIHRRFGIWKTSPGNFVIIPYHHYYFLSNIVAPPPCSFDLLASIALSVTSPPQFDGGGLGNEEESEYSPPTPSLPPFSLSHRFSSSSSSHPPPASHQLPLGCPDPELPDSLTSPTARGVGAGNTNTTGRYQQQQRTSSSLGDGGRTNTITTTQQQQQQQQLGHCTAVLPTASVKGSCDHSIIRCERFSRQVVSTHSLLFVPIP
jgi:hypothetical protein